MGGVGNGGNPTISTTSTSTLLTLTSPYPTSSSTTYSPNLITASPASTSQVAYPKSSSSSKSGNISVVTVAGAAVGAAVGGALLAFLFTFMLLRNRRHKPRQAHRRSEKPNGTKALLNKSSDDLLDPKHAWEKHLPQPADDNSIRLTIKTLLHQVELHVENFYTDSAAPLNVSEDVETELLKLDSPFTPKPLAVLLPQARFKTALIKHCLAHLIISKITTEGAAADTTSQSFLPSEFVALPQAIGRSRSDPNKAAYAQSFSRWRVLTAYLRPAPAPDAVYISTRDAAIAAAAATFCTAFAPWASRTHSHAARLQNLVTIMQSAAEAGLLIFAQPAAFSWTWKVGRSVRGDSSSSGGGGGGREIVLTPGFIKVTDDEAKVLDRPQVMVQQVVNEF